MGCASSKSDEEAVLLCRERKIFIRQALRQRALFASEHHAYLQSLKRVSFALRDYVKLYEHRDLLLDACSIFPSPPELISKTNKASIYSRVLLDKCVKSEKGATSERHLSPGGHPFVLAEENYMLHGNTTPASYYTREESGVNIYLPHEATGNGFTYKLSLPQSSYWDYIWSPFSQSETAWYPSKAALDKIINHDDMAEEIHKLEGTEESCTKAWSLEERINSDSNSVQKHKEGAHDGEIQGQIEPLAVKELESQEKQCVRTSLTKNAMEKGIAGCREIFEETPDFIAYFGHRPTSMVDIINDIESEFIKICDSAQEVSIMLEATGSETLSSNEQIGGRTLHPLAPSCSQSSPSSSSRFLLASYSSRDDDKNSSDFLQNNNVIPENPQSILYRLYIWEKRLYEEVKIEEQLRLEYEKKWRQLKRHDINGDDPLVIEKTKGAIHDLNTRITILIRSMEDISKRIEALRDDELHPQLTEMINRLSEMWRSTAHHHRNQKLLLSESRRLATESPELLAKPPPALLARPAAKLESELRAWQSHLRSWIAAQRSFARALTDWLLRCAPPSGSARAVPPIVAICEGWSRVLEGELGEKEAAEEIELLAASIKAKAEGRGGEREEEREWEGRVGVLYKGLFGAVRALEVMAVGFVEGYEELLGRGMGVEGGVVAMDNQA